MCAQVTITDVRIALNNITPAEVADETIQQKLDDAAAMLTEQGYDVTTFAAKRYIRAWAAWRSFIVSKTYSTIKQADISVQSEWKTKEAGLKADADDAYADLTGSEVMLTDSTPMFDDRPDDPYEGGDSDEAIDDP